jgi:flagellar hook-associated protein 1 FlgK
MASSFGSINTALTSLYAQRRALDVTGQNIANANTEGYTRQRVNMQSQVGSISAAMYAKTDGLGSGVGITDVTRLRDDYLENRGRTEHGNSAYLTAQSASYSSIEDAFGEPNDTALQAQLGQMWDSWSDVANNPKDTAARSALIESSRTVADKLNDLHSTLAGQWSNKRTDMDAYANEVNTTASTVAQLNDSIVKAKATGLTVNELEDRRDVAVMHLSELTGATASARKSGAVDVFVGNSTIVSEFTTSTLEVTGAKRLEDQGTDPLTLRWAATQQPVTAGGTMGSTFDTMTKIIPGISGKLDAVAKQLGDSVNLLHAAGFSADGTTGQNFFAGDSTGTISAGTIKVAITDPAKVAYASTTATLDHSVADSMAELGNSATGADSGYQAMIGELGVAASASTRRNDIQTNVTDQADADRESTSGVNLDEEMTNLLTYQRGYEAASRVLTTVDSMLDQLINRTGLVGR